MFAQAPASRPEFDAFEVATVKPSNLELAAGRFIRMQTTNLRIPGEGERDSGVKVNRIPG